MTTTDEVPGAWNAAINGTPYLMVTGEFRRQTLDVIRQQASSSADDRFAQSLNPQDLWRAAQDDWTGGAGQRYFDHPESRRDRFFSSQGADVWTPGEVTGLPETVAIGSLSGTVGDVLSTGNRIYVVQGNFLSYWDGSSWTACSTTDDGSNTVGTILDIATDGYNVYFTDGTWLYRVDESTDTPQRISDLSCDSVGFVKGRLMVSSGPDLYNITDITPADPADNTPSPIGGLVNDQWEWSTWGEGPSYIYVGGGSNDKSAIWRIGIREDATGLSAAAQAMQMPDGEQVTSMVGYLSLLIVGTTKGVRLCVPQGPALVMGDVISTAHISLGDQPVEGLEPQGRFVYFGWSFFTGAVTGIGRLDLSKFTDDLTPAYASDLMEGSTTKRTMGVCWYDGKPVFSVEDEGVYTAHDSNTVSWDMIVGQVTHGLADDKIYHQLTAQHSSLSPSQILRARVQLDEPTENMQPASPVAEVIDESVSTTGQKRTTWTTDKTVQDAKGSRSIVRLSSTGDVDLYRWVIRSQPVVDRTTVVVLPIDLVESAQRRDYVGSWSPADEYAAIKQLETDGTFVDVQVLGETFQAIVEKVSQGPGLRENEAGDGFEGTCEVVLKVFS